MIIIIIGTIILCLFIGIFLTGLCVLMATMMMICHLFVYCAVCFCFRRVPSFTQSRGIHSLLDGRPTTIRNSFKSPQNVLIIITKINDSAAIYSIVL